MGRPGLSSPCRLGRRRRMPSSAVRRDSFRSRFGSAMRASFKPQARDPDTSPCRSCTDHPGSLRLGFAHGAPQKALAKALSWAPAHAWRCADMRVARIGGAGTSARRRTGRSHGRRSHRKQRRLAATRRPPGHGAGHARPDTDEAADPSRYGHPCVPWRLRADTRMPNRTLAAQGARKRVPNHTTGCREPASAMPLGAGTRRCRVPIAQGATPGRGRDAAESTSPDSACFDAVFGTHQRDATAPAVSAARSVGSARRRRSAPGPRCLGRCDRHRDLAAPAARSRSSRR